MSSTQCSCHPHFKKAKENIINVSSVGGSRAFTGISAYVMSKRCLDLTRTAALELKPDGVRVNSVNLGVIVTELHKRSERGRICKTRERGKIFHALSRVRTVSDVAKAVFLASSSSFTTVITLAVTVVEFKGALVRNENRVYFY